MNKFKQNLRGWIFVGLFAASPLLAQVFINLFQGVRAPGSAGDIYYTVSTAGQITKLPIGDTGAHLQVVGGFPRWVTNTPAFTSTPTNTPTSTPTPTVTPSTTNTPTPTPTFTGTLTATPTSTPTPTPTLTPAVVSGAWFGSAVSFQKNFGNASTAYMTVPDNTALDATTGVSVSAWVIYRGFDNTATSQGIFTKATAAGGTGAAACGDYSLVLNLSSGGVWNPFFGVNGSAACSWGAIAQPSRTTTGGSIDKMTIGEWTHYVGTYSTGQGSAKLYVDGVLLATSGAFSSNLNTTGTIGVAGAFFDKSVAARSCNCTIDDLRIYKNAALSQADVTLLYNGGRGQFPLNLLSANETVVWRFDEGTGTTATDSVSGLVLTSGGALAVDWVRGILPDRGP